MLLFIYSSHTTNTRKPATTHILLYRPSRLGTKRLFYLGCSDFIYELAKKIQILLLQAKEGTGQVGRAKAYDFHTWSSNNPDVHLKHRCDLRVG